tara:strand:- start:1020 stop:1859 length:840 start_codon:yes stop_codon:yes gene_type:complete
MHLSSILLYMASSMAIVMVNKIVLTTYAFPSVSFLLFWQGVVSVLFYSSRVRQKPDRYVLLAGVCHAANTLAGLSAAGSLNVAMFGALRKMSIVLTMVAQWAVFQKRPKDVQMLAVFGIVVGATIAAVHDLTFDARGYAFVMTNNVCTVASQMANKVALQRGVEKETLLLYSSVVSMVFAAGASMSFHPREFEHWSSTPFRMAFGSSLFLGIVLNWAVTWLLDKNDALTLSVSGSLKSTCTGLVVCAGWFDPTYIFSWENFLGLQTTALASFLYIFTGR